MAEVLRWVVIGIALVALAGSLRPARGLRVGASEERMFRFFNNAPDALHAPVWAVMQAGSLWAVFVTGAASWISDEERTAAATVVVGTFVWGGVKLTKHGVGRGRPAVYLQHVHLRGSAQTGLGYPSGHAAVALTLALVATHAARPAVQLGAIGVAVVTAGARMYVGAHLPFDVVGGLAIGAIVGALTGLGLAAWA